jgi:flavin-dependent dehydrogenase
MIDVIVAGAGPAGSIAALTMARAGARVLIVDRDVFPRDKLCGDTLNPGAMAVLASLGLADDLKSRARPLSGMLVSGPGVAVRTTYGAGVSGWSVTRRDLDAWLLEQAIHAGAKFESGVTVHGPLMDDAGAQGSRVRGLVIGARGDRHRVSRMPAAMVIAADGTRSALAQALDLITYPRRSRRWAFGAYATGIDGVSDVGEMHVRPSAYIGLAPLSDTLVNVCVVTGPRPEGRGPVQVMRHIIEGDPALAPRFRSVQWRGSPRVMGPLAASVVMPGVEGLLLAGDAAGFIDPMTGDGLRLAMQGGLLAAREALEALDSADLQGAVRRLADARRETLGRKLQFNRVLRFVSGSATAIALASCGATLAPGLLRRVVRYAGDVVTT